MMKRLIYVIFISIFKMAHFFVKNFFAVTYVTKKVTTNYNISIINILLFKCNFNI